MTYTQYELPLFEAEKTGANAFCIEDGRSLGREDEVIRKAFEILSARHERGASLTQPESTKEFLRIKLAEERNEVFGCIFLDNRNRVIAVEDIFFGTIDGASVHPRVVVQKALGHNAAAIIAYHNHPSGVAEPSEADRRLTQRLKEALALIDVHLLDHLVVCVGECTSFAECGFI